MRHSAERRWARPQAAALSTYGRFVQSQNQHLGSTVQATQALTLSVGQDLAVVAAAPDSPIGATLLAAGGDANILAGRSSTSLATASYAEGSRRFGPGSIQAGLDP